MACFGLVTRRPERPDRSVPSFISCMLLSTFFDAFRLERRAPVLRAPVLRVEVLRVEVFLLEALRLEVFRVVLRAFFDAPEFLRAAMCARLSNKHAFTL